MKRIGFHSRAHQMFTKLCEKKKLKTVHLSFQEHSDLDKNPDYQEILKQVSEKYPDSCLNPIFHAGSGMVSLQIGKIW